MEPLYEMLDSVVKRAGLIASDSDDPHRDSIVVMIESFGIHLASLEGVQIQTGLRRESVELVRQEGQFHLVIAPGQEVILHTDPDKRTFEITSVFLTPNNKIKYRTSANRTIEHRDIFVVPSETLFGWFDPNEDDMLPANKGPLALSIESIRILRPSYTFALKAQDGVWVECVGMEPMIPFQNNDVVLICDPRIASGYGIGKWLESVRKNGDSTVLSCRLRSLDPQSFEDIWAGEFIAGTKPEFGWWAVQRA